MNLMPTFGAKSAANGFNILPVAWGQKFPARWTGKDWKPATDWGRWSARLPTDTEIKHWSTWPDCSVGIACGRFIGIDIDVDNHAHVMLARNIAFDVLGHTTLERVGRPPRRLLLYRTTGETMAPGFWCHPLPVQILGLGQQFVSFGLHPNGSHYQWLDDDPSGVDVSTVPEVTAEMLQAFRARLVADMPKESHDPRAHVDDPETVARAVSGLGAEANLEAITAAMEWIANDDLPYGLWVRVGYALKAAVGAAGWPLFEAFSAKAAKNRPDVTSKMWMGFKPNGKLGAGTIFFEAMRAGWCPAHSLNFSTDTGTMNIDEVIAGLDRKQKKPGEKDKAQDKAQGGTEQGDGDKSADAREQRQAEVAAARMDAELWTALVKPLPQEALYGPLTEIIERVTAKSEATRAGTAMQILAHASLLFRPFVINIGYDRLGLNLFMIQLGLSAVGRKGTSAAFADYVFAPGIRKRAERLRRELAIRQQEAAAAQAEAEPLREEIGQLDSAIRKATTLTSDELAALKNKLVETEARHVLLARQKGDLEVRLSGDKTLSPRTSADYRKEIARLAGEISQLERILPRRRAEIADGETILQGRAAAMSSFTRKRDDAKAHLLKITSRIDRAQPAPWQLMLAELAGRPHNLSGVSSGEGLIDRVRDERETADGEIVPGVDEKRALINLSEFGGVLQQVTRPGSILSSVLRDLYDCRPVATNSKNAPVSCEEPFFSVSAACTPAEFVGLLFHNQFDKAVSAENGLANRFLVTGVARTQLVALPERSPGEDAWLDKVWTNIVAVYRELGPSNPHLSTDVDFTPEGRALWDEHYGEFAVPFAASKDASSLLGRLTGNARKMMAVLAFLNGESCVSAGAVMATVAWMRHSMTGINETVATIQQMVDAEERRAAAELVLKAIRELGDGCTQRDLGRHMRGTLTVDQVKNVLQTMVRHPPSPVRLERNGKKVTIWLTDRGAAP